MTNTMMLDAALWYAQAWPVFPLYTPVFGADGVCVGCSCGYRGDLTKHSTGKHPQTKNGLQDASKDADQLRQWWTASPGANIGLDVGGAGLFVLDFDTDDANFGGQDLLLELWEAHPTTTQQSGGGGFHLLYLQPDGVTLGNSTKGRLPKAVHCRGAGGYIVAAPSLHPSGRRYQWVTGRTPKDIYPRPLPGFLLDLLTRDDSKPVASIAPIEPIVHTAIHDRYAEAALYGELDKLARTGEGGRNEQLNRSAFALGQLVGAGMLDEGTVTTTLADVARAIGLAEGEATKTLASGLKAGKSKPRNTAKIGATPDLVLDHKAQSIGSAIRRIVVNKRQDRDILDDTIEAIRTINAAQSASPILYARAGILSQVATDEDDNHFIRNAEGAVLSSILVRVVDWVKQYRDKTGETYFDDTSIPERIVKMLEVPTSWTHVPPLEGIALAPVFAPDGTLHDRLGYSPATRLYLAGSLDIGDTTPTEDNVARAKQLLTSELMGEFPFVDEASRAHALALLILPFVRPMIAGATPNHLVDAPTAGTGKSLLASLCTIPFAGGKKSTISMTKSEDEFSKAIVTSLLSGRAFICIDNLPQSAILDSAKLASALTEREIADRTMRTHTAMLIRPRAAWITTGNNTKLSVELTRRTVHIRLDRNSETPWLTEGFKHKDIQAWATEHRAELATAAITLVRNWIAKGKPKWTGKPKGSFSDWAQVIGGILQSADVGGFLENEAEMLETSAVGGNELWRAFIDAWWTNHREMIVKVGELFKLASHPDRRGDGDDTPDPTEWLGLLDEELQGLPEAGRRRRFGRMMEERRDVVIGSYKLTRGKVRDGSSTWSLRKVG